MIDRSIAPKIYEPEFFPFPPHYETQLSNGMEVGVIPFNEEEFTTLIIEGKGGESIQQHKGESVLTLNLMRKGTTHHTGKEIADALDFYGADINGSINMKSCFLSTTGLSKNFDKILALLKEIIEEPSFPQKELDGLRNQKIASLQHRMIQPNYIGRCELLKMMYGEDHPVAEQDTPEDYERITVEDLKRIHRQVFGNHDLRLWITGKADTQIMGLIEQTLGVMDYHPQPDTFMLPKAKGSEDHFRLTEKKDFIQSSVQMGMVTINKYAPDYIDLKITNLVLGGYFGSRLTKNIREEKGYTYGIYSYLMGFKDFGEISINAETATQYTQPLIDETKKEIKRMREEEVGIDELNTAKKYFQGQILQEMDKKMDLITSYRRRKADGNNISEYYKNLWSRLQSITPKDLMETANKYLNEDNLYISVAGKMK